VRAAEGKIRAAQSKYLAIENGKFGLNNRWLLCF
jgi:hypothetical protein